jgi:hypothetical protein
MKTPEEELAPYREQSESGHTTLAEGGGDPDTQFRWFVTLWVMAFTFHYFAQLPVDVWPILLVAIPCLIAPSSVAAFTLFLLVGAVVVWTKLPAASNHLVIGILVHAAFALSAAAILWGRRRVSTHRTDSTFRATWIETVRAPVALTLLVVYFFVIFHKLNKSFFHPEVSCSGTLLSQLVRLQGLDVGPMPDGVVLASAYLTVFVEALILFLLAVRRYRRWGVLLGVAFHATLAMANFYDFATFVFAIYVILLPPEATARVPRPEMWRRAALLGWTASGLVGFAAWWSDSIDSPLGLRWHTLQVVTWFLAVGPLMVPLLRTSFATHPTDRPAPRLTFRPVWLVLLPVLAFVNGMTPYLGIKTVANYSMFSNLRTEEGRTNHLLQGVENLEITNRLHDTVDVLELDLPDRPKRWWSPRLSAAHRLRRQTRWAREDAHIRVPWLELRRAALLWKDAGWRDIRIRYVHGGVDRVVLDATMDGELVEPLPWLTRRLVAFREIERGDRPVRCRW